MSKVIRSVKNVTKGYSAAQVKVRDGGSFLLSTVSLLLPPIALSPCGHANVVLGIVRFQLVFWPTFTHHHLV